MATKKEAGSVVVTLPEIEFKTVTIKIKGTAPLVVQPFSLKQMRQIAMKQSGEPQTKKHAIRNKWEDFIQSIYWLSEIPKEWDECKGGILDNFSRYNPECFTEESFIEAAQDGLYGFPVGGIKDSAVTAAVRRGIVKNAPIARSMFGIVGAISDRLYDKQCVKVITPDPPKMRVDCLSTFNSGADMRYRPQFDEWRIEFNVQFDAGILSLDQLLTWFKLGGFACGLGENRPEKGGEWGSYELDM